MITSSDAGCLPELTVEGHIATLRLRRPARLNCLSNQDLLEIIRHCESINAERDVRVVVLTADTTGQSKPIFSAGYDVSGFDSDGYDPHLFENTVNAVAQLRPVVIAGLNGSVYGGATDLILACDLRIAQPNLSWRMPACALGLHYYPSGLHRYLNAFGPDRTRQLFLTAQPVGSEDLHMWGVLMELVQGDDWPHRLRKLSQGVAQLAPLATQATKASIDELARGLSDESRLRSRERCCANSEDFREGRQAMAERRTPVFKGH